MLRRSEPTEGADFSHQCRRDDKANPTQRLQRLDEWCQGPAPHCLLKGAVQSIAAGLGLLNAANAFTEDELLMW